MSPDYGEFDHHVVPRESDIGNGVKFHGWTNPLANTDDGNDDDIVLVLTATEGGFLQRKFKESQLI